ncbi:MAG: molybdenum cofactor biosynthesis protein MoaE [Hyphobacterium sp.]|nr:MAG: molybdenum cofactor biosynthesis protein MoaE [Hyphobacterium sp.]
MPTPVIILTDAPLDLAALSDQLPIDPKTGATSSFTGYVRESGALIALELLQHPVMTRHALDQIAQTAMQRFGVLGLLLVHRYGRMGIGEPIVHIAAAAPHRRAALDAVSFTIDVLKTQAPFWKREWRNDNYDWVEPGGADHEKAAQWLETKT